MGPGPYPIRSAEFPERSPGLFGVLAGNEGRVT
jgi:hypothetical protein